MQIVRSIWTFWFRLEAFPGYFGAQAKLNCRTVRYCLTDSGELSRRWKCMRRWMRIHRQSPFSCMQNPNVDPSRTTSMSEGNKNLIARFGAYKLQVRIWFSHNRLESVNLSSCTCWKKTFYLLAVNYCADMSSKRCIKLTIIQSNLIANINLLSCPWFAEQQNQICWWFWVRFGTGDKVHPSCTKTN